MNGGGNAISAQRIIVRRVAALGDVISATVIADKLKELGHEVTFQSHASAHPILRRVPAVGQVSEPGGYTHIDLDGAYETNVDRRRLHFNDMWFARANQNLHNYGLSLGVPVNARPRLVLSAGEKAIARAKFSDYPKPWVFICPASQYYNVRSVPNGVWEAAAKRINGTCFWLGLFPAPPGIVDLQVRQLSTLLTWLSCADLLITVDTGPMHFAAAMGVRVLAISQSSPPDLHLTDQVDFSCIAPPLECLGCQENQCPISRYTPPCQEINPEEIARACNDKLGSIGVSCVIPIYRPDAAMLNRCLSAVLPQVQEIIVTKEASGLVPAGTITDPKIRHVTHRQNGLGFGRNVNFGFRHTNNPYVLVLNDDVYLDPGAVDKLMECMKPKTGVVGHLTRYPDGTLYHAGKPRAQNGGIGFPHIDYRKYVPTIIEPVEMENTNGASILVRREAFYEVGGFDERFKFYCEDDTICMELRKAGWQVWYTPLATGIHAEHQETKKRPDMMQIMAQSNSLFGQLWAPYFEHNRNNKGLGDFSYLVDSNGRRA